MHVEDLGSRADRDQAKRRLQAVTNRLAVEPARRTVEINVAKAGTRYARVPEPGACPFCLMLGSRGGVYSGETVFGELGRYHDSCRCLAIEVKTDADLPRINRDLAAMSDRLDREFGHPAKKEDWRQAVTAARQQAGGQTVWPRMQYCRIPRYRGDGTSKVFAGEKLPSLRKMPGHVLHGWRDPDPHKPEGEQKGWPHTEDLQQGHRWDSTSGKSVFPKDWTDQEIVDQIRDALESPDGYLAGPVRRTVWKRHRGVLIEVRYNALREGVVKFDTAYPVTKMGKGARRDV